MQFPFWKNSLRKAIERGLANGKLKEELEELGELELQSRGEGEAVCWGLEQLKPGLPGLSDHADTLARLFQDIKDGDCEAVEVLRERGITGLIRVFDEIRKEPDEKNRDALLFILKILGMYGTTAGTLRVIEAAQRPLYADAYMWSVILGTYGKEHPESELLFHSLSDPLPPGFLGISLLDAANAILVEGGSLAHPFDNPAGAERLACWLRSCEEDEFSYARSATAALPFINGPAQDELLALAFEHADTAVRMEAMWAAAKLGREIGLERLVHCCRDFKTAGKAQRYLNELGHAELIPAETQKGEFKALAEFSEWCEHPNELGRAPDELKIADHRELAWPPKREPKPFWLIQFRSRDETGLEPDQVGYGLVGSATWSFFSYDLEQRPPEDAYGFHCYWEMQQHKLIEDADVAEDPGEYQSLLTQWRGPALRNIELTNVAEVMPQLGYPQRLVGVASAMLNGEEGWVVLDGERSEWYPRADRPADERGKTVLEMHVGARLLGLGNRSDRKAFLKSAPEDVPPAQIIAAYEKLLAAARKSEGKKQTKALEYFGPIGKHLSHYGAAMSGAGRGADLRSLIEFLEPFWDHASGHGTLGTVAWKSGHFDLAEGFFIKLRDNYETYGRSDEMDLLAELWVRNGRQEDAKTLLLDCLRQLVEESKTATGSDIRLFEKWFQTRRAGFLKLFPGNGETTLAANAIPASTLRASA